MYQPDKTTNILKIIISKSPLVHWLDSGSNSTIQLTHISTSNMKMGVGGSFLGLRGFNSHQGVWTTHKNSAQFWKN